MGRAGPILCSLAILAGALIFFGDWAFKSGDFTGDTLLGLLAVPLGVGLLALQFWDNAGTALAGSGNPRRASLGAFGLASLGLGVAMLVLGQTGRPVWPALILLGVVLLWFAARSGRRDE